MRVLLLGSGGREHALAWIICKSPQCEKLFIAPGNGGTSNSGINVDLNPADFKSVEDFAITNRIDLIIAGPEDPIVRGISNYFKGKPVKVLAPEAKAALLEGSKDFAKQFMLKYGIPTAAYKTFTRDDDHSARKYISEHPAPIVIKADGLAAGKGVTVCFSKSEALMALDEAFIENKFGESGGKVVIEEFLDGIELSVFVLTDGNNYVLLPEAKDYKRVGEDDTGPNTGGMGSVSPVNFANETFMEKVTRKIIKPTLEGLRAEKLDYRGFIFFGLMNVKGEPLVIEYNVRMGDPETEAVIPRIEDDLLPLLYQAADGNLDQHELKISGDYSVTVMMVSGGYPASFEKNKEIAGLEHIRESNVFHAGTRSEEDKVYTSGGRVLAVNSLAKSQKEAMEKSYRTAKLISFDKAYYRTDIGKDLLTFEG